MDCGLNLKKRRGSLANRPGADRYPSSVTLAPIAEGCLIVILRPGTVERGAGRRNPAETKLRGGEFTGVAVRAL